MANLYRDDEEDCVFFYAAFLELSINFGASGDFDIWRVRHALFVRDESIIDNY